MFRIKFVEKIKTSDVCPAKFFIRKSCHLWANVLKYCSAGLETCPYGACSLHAEYLRLQIHALVLCNPHCFATVTKFARTRLTVTFHVHCLPGEIGRRVAGWSAPGAGNGLHLLTPELKPSAQSCLTRFFTGDFASWTVHFTNICVKTQQIHQLFIQFINYVW
jgi:hypothetical protein